MGTAVGQAEAFVFPQRVAAQEPPGVLLYWTERETGKIRRARLDGDELPETETETIISGQDGPIEIDVDESTGRMYWIRYFDDGDPDLVFRADLGGRDGEGLVSESPEFHDVIFADELYLSHFNLVADAAHTSIRRWNDVSGSSGVAGTNSVPFGIDYDPVARKLYFGTLNGAIWRMNTDGTDQESVLLVGDPSRPMTHPRDVALDVTRGKIYWAAHVSDNADDDEIWRADLAGTRKQALVTGLGNVTSIAVDSRRGKIYWTDIRQRTIDKANLDGSGHKVLKEHVVSHGIAVHKYVDEVKLTVAIEDASAEDDAPPEVRSRGGFVASDDGQIQCGPGVSASSCSQDVPVYSRPIVTAVPDADYVFVGWRGAQCRDISLCTNRVHELDELVADTVVTAVFRPLEPVTLTVDVNRLHGSSGRVTDGAGDIDCRSIARGPIRTEHRSPCGHTRDSARSSTAGAVHLATAMVPHAPSCCSTIPPSPRRLSRAPIPRSR